MDPINYILDVKSPIEQALKGFALGRQDIEQNQVMAEREQMMDLRAAQEARAAAQEKDRRAKAASERARAEAMKAQMVNLRDMAINGTLTTDAVNQVILGNAETFDEFKTAFSAIEEAKKQPQIQFTIETLIPSLMGNKDATLSIFDERIAAAQNAGTPEAMAEAQALTAARSVVEADPASYGAAALTRLVAAGDITTEQADMILKTAGQGAETTESFDTADQKLRAAGIVPRSEGGDGRYEDAMAKSVSGGGKGDISLTVDPATGAVTFAQGEGAGVGVGRPATGYVTVQTDAGAEQRVITGSPAAQEVAATAAQLDAAMEQANRLVGLVETVRDDQELDAVTGFAEGRMPTGRPSLSPEKIQARQDLIVKIDQLQGNVFLQAYESLKGSGQITEIEGIKAEAAIARMNRAQGAPAFKAALNDFLDVVSTAQKRIEREKSGIPQTTAPTAGAPAGGRLKFDENGDPIQ